MSTVVSRLTDVAARLAPQGDQTWIQPSTHEKYVTGLRLHNSMASKVVEFIPREPGKKVYWYGCGPTVYDAAHLGHARTYIMFDVIRRVMTDYFGYDVVMCMNITDIDDKIIQRSLDEKTDFSQLARHWEMMFWKDMQQLNVQYPDVITRVSEYLPEIINFIERIIANGFAYVSQGSVYFDIRSFQAAPSHCYGRLEPSAINDSERVLEGEGALGIVTEKRCPLDFALWKKAKDNEPHWDSPWGPGRPGWHIECSTMASQILGFPLDIHSGGVDLKFPHHDNELAQSEACFNKPQWVNYFLHSGHLHIKGSKMSKSLKNFITIQQFLSTTSPRVIRLLFLLHRWNAPMNYSLDGESMQEAAEIDRILVAFFSAIRLEQRRAEATQPGQPSLLHLSGCQKWRQHEVSYHQTILDTMTQIHEAFSDNIDTPAVLQSLRSLVTATNSYLKVEGPRLPLVLKAAAYIFKILKTMGLTTGDDRNFSYDQDEENTSAGLSENARLMDAVIDFRSHIRQTAKALAKDIRKSSSPSGEAQAHLQSIFSRCDEMRDQTLQRLGYCVEDTLTTSTWRRMTKEEKSALNASEE